MHKKLKKIISVFFLLTICLFGTAQENKKVLIAQLMTVPNAIDVNKDNVLTAEEVHAAPRNLKKLDRNGDGALDKLEIGAWSKNLPLIRNHNITNVIDINGDIQISAEEIKIIFINLLWIILV